VGHIFFQLSGAPALRSTIVTFRWDTLDGFQATLDVGVRGTPPPRVGV